MPGEMKADTKLSVDTHRVSPVKVSSGSILGCFACYRSGSSGVMRTFRSTSRAPSGGLNSNSSSGVATVKSHLWGNKLTAGDYKYIGQFPHYVAGGGDENNNSWFEEEVNLLEIYHQIWPDQRPARMTEIGLFCDSDDTDTQSVSYFANVRVKRSQ